MPSTTDEMTIAWDELRTAHPGLFTCPAGDQLSWHEHEAEACEIQKNWVGAAFHLGPLIENGPPRWEICARRANVAAGDNVIAGPEMMSISCCWLCQKRTAVS